MKLKLLLFILFIPQNIYNEKFHTNARIEFIIKKIFNKETGIQEPIHIQNKFENVLSLIYQSNQYQKLQAIQHVITYLKAEIAHSKISIEKADKINFFAAHLKYFLLKHYHFILTNYYKKLQETTTISQHITGFIVNLFETIQCSIKKYTKKTQLQEPFIIDLFNNLIWYLNYEQNTIFTNYTKTKHFIAILNCTPHIPKIIQFWDETDDQNSLLYMIKNIYPPVKIQAALAVDVAEDAAESVAESAISNVATSATTQTTELATEVAKESSQTALTATTNNATQAAEHTLSTLSDEELEQIPIKKLIEIIDHENIDQNSELFNIMNGEQPPENALQIEQPEEDDDNDEAYEDSKIEIIEEPKDFPDDENSEKPKKKLTTAQKILQPFKWIAKPFHAISDGAIEAMFGDASEPTAGLSKWGKKWFAFKTGTPRMVVKMAIDMTLQSELMQSSGMIGFWVSQHNQKYFQDLAAQNTKNSQTMNTKIALAGAISQIKISKIKTNFFTKTKNIQKTQSSFEIFNGKRNQAIIETINNLYTPNHYLKNPMLLDQLFSLSEMLTPIGQKWHNIYRIGNWQYNPYINGFIQYQKIPYTSNDFPQTGDPALGILNTIFTEYIPDQSIDTIKSYKIKIIITLQQHIYPFFVGILFNNARWISGVTDLYHQQRLFGLYGSIQSQTQNQIALTFAETILNDKNQQSQNKQNVSWPLMQIPTKTPLLIFNKSLQKSTDNQATTFIFTIQTKPDSAMLTLSQQNNNGSETILYGPQPISSLNQKLYKYHGIGLISAGCSAKFILQEPSSLVYNKEQIQQFQTTIKGLS